MSRRRAAEKRQILPDPLFKDMELAKFINIVMVDGKKSVAESIVYGALDNASTKRGASESIYECEKARSVAMDTFNAAIENIKPHVMVKSRRVGGANYQVPMEVNASAKKALSKRWLVEAARKRSEPTMERRLAAEILDAAEGRGGAVRKREDSHKMAEANKAFSHFRW